MLQASNPARGTNALALMLPPGGGPASPRLRSRKVRTPRGTGSVSVRRHKGPSLLLLLLALLSLGVLCLFARSFGRFRAPCLEFFELTSNALVLFRGASRLSHWPLHAALPLSSLSQWE